MTTATASLTANGAILVGGGGASSWSFSPGASHRSEQAVLLVQSGARAYLTNCAVIHTAGQVGNGYFSDVIFDHCLLQKAITAGEYEGGLVVLNHSAVIEFPEDNGVVNPAIADADYDAIYFTEGTHILMNSLVGFCKDDAMDSSALLACLEKSRARRPQTARDLATRLGRVPTAASWTLDDAEAWWGRHERAEASPAAATATPAAPAAERTSTSGFDQTIASEP
jgi:hypothetical protein